MGFTRLHTMDSLLLPHHPSRSVAACQALPQLRACRPHRLQLDWEELPPPSSTNGSGTAGLQYRQLELALRSVSHPPPPSPWSQWHLPALGTPPDQGSPPRPPPVVAWSMTANVLVAVLDSADSSTTLASGGGSDSSGIPLVHAHQLQEGSLSLSLRVAISPEGALQVLAVGRASSPPAVLWTLRDSCSGAPQLTGQSPPPAPPPRGAWGELWADAVGDVARLGLLLSARRPALALDSVTGEPLVHCSDGSVVRL